MGKYYLISLAADEDGFYGPLLESSSDLKHKLIVDPHSNIGSFLYNKEEDHSRIFSRLCTCNGGKLPKC